jgi:hypothetical protein
MTRRLGRRLAPLLGATYLVLGVLELVRHNDESAIALLYWAISLLGGGILVLAGLRAMPRSRDVGRGLVAVGAAFGVVPTLWTIVIPAVALVVIARVLREPQALPR